MLEGGEERMFCIHHQVEARAPRLLDSTEASIAFALGSLPGPQPLFTHLGQAKKKKKIIEHQEPRFLSFGDRVHL